MSPTFTTLKSAARLRLRRGEGPRSLRRRRCRRFGRDFSKSSPEISSSSSRAPAADTILETLTLALVPRHGSTSTVWAATLPPPAHSNTRARAHAHARLARALGHPHNEAFVGVQAAPAKPPQRRSGPEATSEVRKTLVPVRHRPSSGGRGPESQRVCVCTAAAPLGSRRPVCFVWTAECVRAHRRSEGNRAENRHTSQNHHTQHVNTDTVARQQGLFAGYRWAPELVPEWFIYIVGTVLRTAAIGPLRSHDDSGSGSTDLTGFTGIIRADTGSTFRCEVRVCVSEGAAAGFCPA